MSRSLLRAFPFSNIRPKPPQFLPILHHISHLRLPQSISTTQTPVSSFSTSATPPPSSATETLVPTSNSHSPFKDSLQWINRTALCGELSVDDVGKRVRLCGWVALHRVHGGLTFLNLRDHSGIVQVTTLPNEFPDAHSAINDLRLEYVVAVEGTVRSRPGDSVNVKMKTGFIEVAAEHVQILNSVGSKLPFLVTTADDAKDSAKEEIRLRLRRQYFLDLLRKALEIIWCRLEFRSDSIYMYILKPGTFFALPQSPQLFKQMLMVSGFDKYYQIARCFRDEDLRADRQPEFTQLDMELSFTTLEDMLRLNEDLIRKVFWEVKGVQLPNPFPRLTYAEAMSRYGSDRPDTRFDLQLNDVSDIFADSPFKVFADALSSGGIIKVLCVPSGAKRYSNTALKKGDIYTEAMKSGAKGLPFLKVTDDGTIPSLLKISNMLKMSIVEMVSGMFFGDIFQVALKGFLP
uniref:Aspartyl-tRNA synthetase n=1 Tax=Cucumis melo subsp. melo TaxID=412675 RepID=E5GBH9_CUCME|nr:aspartyl-tRNA synthetase [Cucumis melo subsp. melo]